MVRAYSSPARGPNVIEGLTDLGHQIATGIVGPQAVVPWWALVAWLIVIFGGILAPGIKAMRDEDEDQKS